MGWCWYATRPLVFTLLSVMTDSWWRENGSRMQQQELRPRIQDDEQGDTEKIIQPPHCPRQGKIFLFDFSHSADLYNVLVSHRYKVVSSNLPKARNLGSTRATYSVVSTSCWLRQASTTRYPPMASIRSAMANPRPRFAPVITTFLRALPSSNRALPPAALAAILCPSRRLLRRKLLLGTARLEVKQELHTWPQRKPGRIRGRWRWWRPPGALALQDAAASRTAGIIAAVTNHTRP